MELYAIAVALGAVAVGVAVVHKIADRIWATAERRKLAAMHRVFLYGVDGQAPVEDSSCV
jgi:hypothetical protein